MKKALIVASTAGFARGFLLHDMQQLQQMGYEVHCAANGKNVSFEPVAFFRERNVVFHQLDFPVRKPFSLETILAAKQFRRLLKGYKYEFIHCHTPIVGAVVRVMALPLWLAKKCRIAYTTHGLAFPKGCSRKDKLIYGGIEYICSHICDAVITINREDYGVIQSFGCRKAYYINGVGVDTARFRHLDIDRSTYRKSLGVQDDQVMVLAVGELSARKNHQIIVRALSEINDKRFVFVICGKAMDSDTTVEQIKRLSAELDVPVILLGFRRDIPQITNCADIAVLPSLREGLGLAGIEALAAGIPVVGANVQGIKDYVIDGKTGFLCDPRDPADVAEKIKKLSDWNQREKMRPFCQEQAEKFSVDVSCKQMETIYKELLEKEQVEKR